MTRETIEKKYGKGLPEPVIQLLITLGLELGEELIKLIIDSINKNKTKRQLKKIKRNESKSTGN